MLIFLIFQVSNNSIWVTDTNAEVLIAMLVAIRRQQCNALLNVGMKRQRKRAKMSETVSLWTMDSIAVMVRKKGIAGMNMGLRVINPANNLTTKIITACTSWKESVSIIIYFWDSIILCHNNDHINQGYYLINLWQLQDVTIVTLLRLPTENLAQVTLYVWELLIPVSHAQKVCLRV